MREGKLRGMLIMKIHNTKNKKYDIILTIQSIKWLLNIVNIILLEIIMWNDLSATKSWEQPAATEMRFGFEVTLYVMNR